MAKGSQTVQFPEVVMPHCEARKILSGQTALVTGANSGIGKKVALGMGAAGANVVVNYIRGERASLRSLGLSKS